MKKIINYFSLKEWIIYLSSVFTIIICFIIFKNNNYLNLIGTLIGVTSLIFIAKANPIGQILTIIFSIFYGLVSLKYNYYGEMITYMFMTLPIAVFTLIIWLKNPYNGQKNEVKLISLKKREYIFMFILTLIITLIFYFILKSLNTSNLLISTISVSTSFIACYLSFRRTRFYALGYACNDIVLIILWILASIDDITYTSLVICFITFLINDIYGFINWTKLYKKQNTN